MDEKDRKILAELQADCRRPIAEIADRIGLSLSACARRISLLETQGYIESYGARLNAGLLGYGMTFYVEVSLDNQTDAALAEFEKAALRRLEVLECHLMTGDADYLMKVATKDTSDYESVYRKVIAALPHVNRIQTALVMKTVKPWLGYQVE
jgi:DNA-binding Lrp family transcriptional regulator